MGGSTNLVIYIIYGIVGVSVLFLMHLFRRYLLLAAMPPLVAIAVYIIVHHFRLHP